MYTIQQNEASAAERRIPFAMIDASANTHLDNINFSFSGTTAVLVSKNGGTPATAVGSCFQVASPMSGMYYYQASTSEVDTPGFLTLRIQSTSAYPQWPTVQIVRGMNVSAGVIETKMVDSSAGVIGATTIAASAITSTRIDGAVNAAVVSMSAGVIGSTTIAASAIATTKINGTLPVNVININSVLVSGVGSAANPWGPA